MSTLVLFWLILPICPALQSPLSFPIPMHFLAIVAIQLSSIRYFFTFPHLPSNFEQI